MIDPALAKVTAYGEWRQQPSGVLPLFDNIRVDAARRIIEQSLERGDGWLSPVEIHDLFSAVGITMARSRLVASADEAVLNALVVNDDMVGRDGHRSPALPHARLKTLLHLSP